MQAVRAHNASFAWSTRFKSAGGIDIVPSSFEGKRALFFGCNRKRCGSVYVSGVLILCLRFGSLGRLAGISGREQQQLPDLLPTFPAQSNIHHLYLERCRSTLVPHHRPSFRFTLSPSPVLWLPPAEPLTWCLQVMGLTNSSCPPSRI